MKTLWLPTILIVGCSLGGCVRRTVAIRSEPSEAMVYVDGQKMGQTPLTFEFAHYGTRKFTLVKKEADTGRVTHRMTAFERLRPPFYERFPIDFISEVLIPFTLEDGHEFDYKLEKPDPPSREDLLRRANELREQAYAPVTR